MPFPPSSWPTYRAQLFHYPACFGLNCEFSASRYSSGLGSLTLWKCVGCTRKWDSAGENRETNKCSVKGNKKQERKSPASTLMKSEARYILAKMWPPLTPITREQTLLFHGLFSAGLVQCAIYHTIDHPYGSHQTSSSSSSFALCRASWNWK